MNSEIANGSPIPIPKKLEWGLQPPDGSPAAWGARAIVQDRDAEERESLSRYGYQRPSKGPKSPRFTLDLLHDRQDVWPAPTTEGRAVEMLRRVMLNRALTTMLDGRVLKDVRSTFNTHLSGIQGLPRDQREGRRPFLAYSAGSPKHVTLQVDVRVAGGYAYLCAFIVPDDEGWQNAVWSGSGPVPEPGDLVKVGTNDMGDCVVLRRAVVDGFCALHVLPLNAPEWYRTQYGAHEPLDVFGAGLESPPVTFVPFGTSTVEKVHAAQEQAEVYVVGYLNNDPNRCLLLDRRYRGLAVVTREVGDALVGLSTVTSRWRDYKLSHDALGIPADTLFHGLWIAHPQSEEAKLRS